MSRLPEDKGRTRVVTTDRSVWNRPARVWAKRDILALLVRRDLKVRYANSVLGYLWTILDPLLMGMTYWFVFGVLFPRDVGTGPYLIFLLAALLPWQWFNSAINEGSQSLKRDGALIRSTALPREIWVCRVVLGKLVEFVFSLPVLILFVLLYEFVFAQERLDLNPRLLLFPMAMLMQLLLLLGLNLVLAPLVVLLQDLEPIIRITLRWLMYASPVIYSIDLLYTDKVPGWVEPLFLSNPLTGILSLYRAGLFNGPAHWDAVAIAAGEVAVLLFVGLWVFAKCEPTVLKEL